MASKNTANALVASLFGRWQALAAREQNLLRLAAVLVSCTLLWQLGLAPALKVLRAAPAQQASLDGQLLQMQRLQAQARALQAMSTLDAPAQRKALEAAIKPLGAAAQLSGQADRLTVTLRSVNAQALAQVLAAVRHNARLLPQEVHVQRTAARVWDGTLVFQLTSP